MTDTPRHCMDLFCGAGGMSLGLERAGFTISGAFEMDDLAGKSHALNFDSAVTGFGEEQGDVSTLDFGEVSERLARAGISRLDLISGGPPCQGFSRAGRGKIASLDDDRKAFAHDTRNTLVHDFCRAVECLRPRAVLIENVTGMLNLAGVNHADAVCQRLEQAGYGVRVTVLNAAWYGTPQNRERLFIMALAPGERTPRGNWFPEPRYQGRSRESSVGQHALDQAAFGSSSHVERHWPASSCPPAISVSEALDDLPAFTAHLEQDTYRASRDLHDAVPYPEKVELSDYARLMRVWDGRHQSTQVHDHFCRYTPRDFETFSRMEHGARYPRAVEIASERYREAVTRWSTHGKGGKPQPGHEEYIPPYPLGSFDERWQKLDPARPSWTVTAHLSRDCYSHIHHDDDQARTISVREAARLQSFPDAFKLSGSMGACFRQIGNAVPPLLASAIGMRIMTHLDAVPHRPIFTARPHRPVHSTWAVIHDAP